jgi:peptide/nickel transport system permease protein
MARFIARRLLGMTAVLFAISVIVFLIFNVIPNSDPAARIAGKNADPELIARVSADLGLDQPLPVQYLTMMRQILTGELTSYASSQNVVEQIWRGLPATLSLCIGAAVLWMTLAIVFGYLSAVHSGRFTDRALTILSLAGISMPVFWLAAILLYYLSFKACFGRTCST